MTPGVGTTPKRQRQRALQAQLEQLNARLERAERKQLQLTNTMFALARENGLSVGCSCTRCDRSYLLVKGGVMSCPVCGYKQMM